MNFYLFNPDEAGEILLVIHNSANICSALIFAFNHKLQIDVRVSSPMHDAWNL